MTKPYKNLNEFILIPKLPAHRGLKIKINSNFHMVLLKILIELDKSTNKTIYIFQNQQSASVISQRPNFTIADCSASADCENCSLGYSLVTRSINGNDSTTVNVQLLNTPLLPTLHWVALALCQGYTMGGKCRR